MGAVVVRNAEADLDGDYPNDPSIVYVGTHDDGVIRSTDGGAHWAAVNTGFDLTDPTPQPPSAVSGLAIDPVTSTVDAVAGTP